MKRILYEENYLAKNLFKIFLTFEISHAWTRDAAQCSINDNRLCGRETRADRRGSLNLRRLKMQISSICLRESRDVGRRSSSVRYEKGLEKRSTRGKHARRQSRGISLINPNRLSTSCRRASLGSDPLARATITKRSFPLSILSSFSCVSVAPPRWSTTRTIIF